VVVVVDAVDREDGVDEVVEGEGVVVGVCEVGSELAIKIRELGSKTCDGNLDRKAPLAQREQTHCVQRRTRPPTLCSHVCVGLRFEMWKEVLLYCPLGGFTSPKRLSKRVLRQEDPHIPRTNHFRKEIDEYDSAIMSFKCLSSMWLVSYWGTECALDTRHRQVLTSQTAFR
jgi:hypothetical protein